MEHLQQGNLVRREREAGDIIPPLINTNQSKRNAAAPPCCRVAQDTKIALKAKNLLN
jgi:hypothetical protein